MKQLVYALILVFSNLDLVWGETNPIRLSDVAFTATCDGTIQRFILMLPAEFQPEQSHDILIVLHGHGSDRWQFVRDERDECRAARDVAAAHKMIYVSPDYRAKTSWMGQKAEQDTVQILAELKQKYLIARVFICGASMGGTAALIFATLHPKLIDGVASMNGTANLVDFAGFSSAIEASFGGNRTSALDEYRKRSPEFWPQKLTMPIGFAVSGKDDVVPPQSVLRLATALKDRDCDVRIIHRIDLGHSTSYNDAKEILDYVIKKAHPNRRNQKHDF